MVRHVLHLILAVVVSTLWLTRDSRNPETWLTGWVAGALGAFVGYALGNILLAWGGRMSAARPCADFSHLVPVYDPRATRAKPKGAEPSRLQVKTAKVKSEAKDEARWKREVWKRDGGKCRWCRREVRKCLDLVADRGEVHHVSGRVVLAIRWDRRNGLLLCAADHERITGKVAEKFLIHSKHTFTVDGIQYINADKPVRYQRVV